MNPLLFAAVSSEDRSGMPSELLYADDLVRVAPTMEQLGRRMAEWVDTLDGMDLAATARIRNVWMKFREHLTFLKSRAPPLQMKR